MTHATVNGFANFACMEALGTPSAFRGPKVVSGAYLSWLDYE